MEDNEFGRPSKPSYNTDFRYFEDAKDHIAKQQEINTIMDQRMNRDFEEDV